MLVNTTCPNCGAQLDIDNSRETLFCSYCGTKILMSQKIEINQTITQNVYHTGRVEYKLDRSSDATLYIHFSSINPRVTMVVRIVETNQKSVFVNGQKMSFHLAPGSHALVLKIGKKNYGRTIFVPDDYSPVNIYASFDGRARITIDQPTYTLSQRSSIDTSAERGFAVQQPPLPGQTMPQQTNADYSTNKQYDAPPSIQTAKPRPSWMAILGFILSFTLYLSPVALGLCILDMVKNKGKRQSGLTIAGICISAFMIIVLIFSLFSQG